MFTGIITAIGTVAATSPIGEGHDMRLRIATPPGWLEGVQLGASIACSGCCLTAVALEPEAFEVEASAETLSLTTLGGWRAGTRINLERALRMGDELGGHVVSGHVDGLAEVVSVTPENGSTRWRFAVAPELGRFIAPKGSVTLNGVSLTVNEVLGDGTAQGSNGTVFGVNLIPHTQLATTFGELAPGSRINLEIDMLARYVARLVGSAVPGPTPGLAPGAAA
ncbi:riboflavin synthase [Roseomonas sp. OT10]|uniref:riboflavin synthase n=1 Tax=Roseomonas cutis TaxID=2897332 RepID=UPI001E5B57BE|nr:riboflavin synthase [Roseomonas sp. OT10]UFN50759.1 riboflavin synthase [Roseomonas sp. OT10]